MDTRFIQAHREARWSFWLAVTYLLFWGVLPWLPTSKSGITGLPLWFEVSCLLLPLLFILLCSLMIKKIFRDIPLEDNDEK
ncbi:MAG: putative membrane protein YhdT [Candidatus Erwinia impunctatus]|nr:putative membrane protein YhdT [Culicoides impunctatus]